MIGSFGLCGGRARRLRCWLRGWTCRRFCLFLVPFVGLLGSERVFTGLDNGVIEGSGAMDDWEEFFVPLISQSGPIARMF